MKQINDYINQLVELTIGYAPKILLATLVLIIGLWLIRQVRTVTSRTFGRSSTINQEVKTFLDSLVGFGLKILLLTSAAGIVGIETTSLVGIIAAMGFAVGLSLQGNLSNFASGILIMVFRPFKVGDEVKIKDYRAYVTEIQIFHTILRKFDQTQVTIPNNMLMTSPIHNLSANKIRSIEFEIRLPFHENLGKAINIVKETAYDIPEVIKEDEPFVWVNNFGTHTVLVKVFLKVPQEHFWATDFQVRKAIMEAFAHHKIQVSYPEGVSYGEFGSDKNVYPNKMGFKE
ncbi:mechanosensitive ion channel family protein [Microscilla marina]|uniref:Transporter, small conductance mechanosensitive ion channel (MscS) family n=1 Tax=Microscilla marina ATCC 23134 TaxID=313606 RepID=A1ZU44_MICM2|nr:mechanosensitive ion channel [Microscilla marina]EAY26157.1 transporter, small conductance mechanosensitive ion channel (MscS) family [Microscilla marina ATCC 23134]